MQPRSANAESWSSRSMDYFLLRADAILFATVDEMAARHDKTTSVMLTDLNIVSSRWKSLPDNLELVASGIPDKSELKVVAHQPGLKKGTRYLFFLRGGEYESLPILGGIQAIYELGDDATVKCAGGQIYGIGARSLTCSVPDRQVGNGINELGLTARLKVALSKARLRKPTLERAEHEAQRALKTVPRTKQ